MAKEERQGCLLQAPPPSSTPAPLLESEDSIALMQSSIEQTTRRLELEKRRLYDLSDALEKAQAEYDEKRTRYSYNKSDAMHELAKAEKHLRLLENRVAQATSKHNIVTSAIADLRSSIDKHRKDRLSLDQVNRYLTREIQLKEFELKTLQAEMASQVDEKQQTLSLKGRICEAREKEREEFRKLTIEKEKIFRDHERELKMLQAKSEKGQEHLCAQIRCNEFAVSADERLVDPETLMKHILKTTLLNTMQRYAIRQHKKQMEVFERAMDSIKASTGISDADEIVRIFTLLEERNFSAITYVNTINQEIKDMENRKKAIMERIQEHLEHGGKAEKITQELLNEVKDQIQSITHQMEVREERILGQTQALEKVRLHVSDCVSLIEREDSGFQPPRELAIKEAGSTTSLIEMLQYVESFVAFKADKLRESGFLPCPASRPKGWGGGPQQKAPEVHEHREEAIKVPGFPHLATEPRLSMKHRGTASVRPKNLPSAHADSGSDDYEACERPLTDMELRTRTAQSFVKRRRRDQRGSEKRSLLSDSSRPDTPESRFPEMGEELRRGDCAEAAGGGACLGAEAHRRLTHLMRDHSPRASITQGVLSSRSLQLPLQRTRTRSKTAACTSRLHTRKQQQGRPSRNDLQANPRSAAAYEEAQPAAAAAAATEATKHTRSQSAVLSADAGSEAGRLGPRATSAADPAEGALILTQQQEDIPFAGARQLSLEEAAAPTGAESRGVREAQEAHEPNESSELPGVFGHSVSGLLKTREDEAIPLIADKEEDPPTWSRATGPFNEQTTEDLVRSSVEDASAQQAALLQQEGEKQALAERDASDEAPNESLDRLEDPIPASGPPNTDAGDACETQDMLPLVAATQDPETARKSSAAFVAEGEEAASAEAPSKPSSLPSAPSEKADACSPTQSDDSDSPVLDVVSDGGEAQQPKACNGESLTEPGVSSAYGLGRAVSPMQAQELEGQQPLPEECTHLEGACSEEEETAMVSPATDSPEEGREGSDVDASNTVEAPAGTAAAAAAAAPAAPALAVAPDAPASAEVSPKSCLLGNPSLADLRDSGIPLPEDEAAATRQLLETEKTASALEEPQGEGHHQGLKSSAQRRQGSTGQLRPRAERQETASKAWLCAMATEQQGQAEGGGLSAGFSEEVAYEEAELGEAVPPATPQSDNEREEAQAETEETLDHCRPFRAPEGSALDNPPCLSSPSPSDDPPQTSEGSAAHEFSLPPGEADALVQPEFDSKPAAPACNEHIEDESKGHDGEEALFSEGPRGKPCSFSHVLNSGDFEETEFSQSEEEVSMQQPLTATRASVAASAAVAAATSAAAARSSSLAGRGSLTIAALTAAAAASCAAASVSSPRASSALGNQQPEAKTETEEDRSSHAQEGDASAEADEGRALEDADAHEQLEGPPALESSSSCFDSLTPVVPGDSDDRQQQVARGLVEAQAADAPAAAVHAAAEAVAAAPPSISEEAAGRCPQRLSNAAPRSSILRRQSAANHAGDKDKRVLFLSSPDEAASTERPDAPCPREEHCPEEPPLEEGRRTSRCSLLDREEGLTIRAARLGQGLAFAEVDESPLEGGEKTAEGDASLGEAAAFELLEDAGQLHISDEKGTAAAGGEVVSADAAQAAEGRVTQPFAQLQEGALKAEDDESGAGDTEAATNLSFEVELGSCETADKSSSQRITSVAIVEEGSLVRQGTPREDETDEVAALRGAATDARTDGHMTAAAEAAVVDESQQLARQTFEKAAAGEGTGERASSTAQPQAVDCRSPSAEGVPSLAAAATAAAASAAAPLEQQGHRLQEGGTVDVQQSGAAGQRISTEEICADDEAEKVAEELQRPPSGAEGVCFVAAGEKEGLRGELSTQLQPMTGPDSPGAGSGRSCTASPAAEGGEGDTRPPTEPQTTPEHLIASGHVGELESQETGRWPSAIFTEGSSSAAADRAAEAGLEPPRGLEGEPEGPPEDDLSACMMPNSKLSSQTLAHSKAGLADDFPLRDSAALNSSGFSPAAEAALEQLSPAAAAACGLKKAKALEIEDNEQEALAHDTSLYPHLHEAKGLTSLPGGVDAAPAGDFVMTDKTAEDFSSSADCSALSRIVVASGEVGGPLNGDVSSGGDQFSSKDKGTRTGLFGVDEEENLFSTGPPQASEGLSVDSPVRGTSPQEDEGFTATAEPQQESESPFHFAPSVEGSFPEAAAGQEREGEAVSASEGLGASPQEQDSLVRRADSQGKGSFYGGKEDGEAEKPLSPTSSLQPCVSSLEKAEASRFEASVEGRVSPLAADEESFSGAAIQPQQQQQHKEGNASQPAEPPSCSFLAGRQQPETALGRSGNLSHEGEEAHAGVGSFKKGTSFEGLPSAFPLDRSCVGAETEKVAAFGSSQELQQSTPGPSGPKEPNDACSSSAASGGVDAATLTELLQQEASAKADGEESPLLFCPREGLAGGAADKAASASFVQKLDLSDADAAPLLRHPLILGSLVREEEETNPRDVQAYFSEVREQQQTDEGGPLAAGTPSHGTDWPADAATAAEAALAAANHRAGAATSAASDGTEAAASLAARCAVSGPVAAEAATAAVGAAGHSTAVEASRKREEAEAAAPAGAAAAETAAAREVLPLNAANDIAVEVSRAAAPEAAAAESVQTAAGSSIAAALEDQTYTLVAGSLGASPAADAAPGEVAAASGSTEAPASGIDAVKSAAALKLSAEEAAAEAAASESPGASAAAPDAAGAAGAAASAADATACNKSPSASAAAAKAADAAPSLGAAADDAAAHEAADAPRGAALPGEAPMVGANRTASAGAAAAAAVDSSEMLAAAATAGAALDVVEELSDRAATEAAEAAPAAQLDNAAEPAVDSAASEEAAEANNAVEEPATRAFASVAKASQALIPVSAADVHAAAVPLANDEADAAATEAAAAPSVESGEEAAADVSLKAAADAAVDAGAALDVVAGAAADTAPDFASDAAAHSDADAPSDTATSAMLRSDPTADAEAAAGAEAAADTAACLPSHTAKADTATDADVEAYANVAAAAEATDSVEYMAAQEADAPAGPTNGAEATGAAANCRAYAAADATADAAAEQAAATEAGAAAEVTAEAAGEVEDEAAAAETARVDAASHVGAEASPTSLSAQVAADNARAAGVATKAEAAAANLPASDASAVAARPDSPAADAAADAAAPCTAAASADGGRDAGGDSAASTEAAAADAEVESGADANAPADAAAEAATEAAAGGVPDAEANSQDGAIAAGSPHATEPPEKASVWEPPTARETVADAAPGGAAGDAAADYEASACEHRPSAMAGRGGIEAAPDLLHAIELPPSPQHHSNSNAEAEEAAGCMQQEDGIISDSVELDQIDCEKGPQENETPEGDDEASRGRLRGPPDSALPPSEAPGLLMSLSDALPSDGNCPVDDLPQASPHAAESGKDSDVITRDQLLPTKPAEGPSQPFPSAGAHRAPSSESNQNQLGPTSQPTQLPSSQPLEPYSRSASKIFLEEGAPLSGSREASEATCLERALEITRGPSPLPEEDAVASAGRPPSAFSRGTATSIVHSSASAAEESQAGTAEQQDEVEPACPCEQGGASSPSESTDRNSKQERQSLERPLNSINRENHGQQLLQRAGSVLSPSQQSASALFELSPTSASATGSQKLLPETLPLGSEDAQEPEAAARLHASPLSPQSSSSEEALMGAQGPLDLLEEGPQPRSPQITPTFQQLNTSENLCMPGEIAGGCSPLPSQKLAEAISPQGSLVIKPAEPASPEEAGGLQPRSASQDIVWGRLSAGSQPPHEAQDSSSAPHDTETGSLELKQRLSMNGGEAGGPPYTGVATDGSCERLGQLMASPSSALGFTDEAESGDGDLKDSFLRSADKQVSVQLHASPGDQLRLAKEGLGMERHPAPSALSRVSSASQPLPEQLEPPVSCSPSDKPILSSCPEEVSFDALRPGGSAVEAASGLAAAESRREPSDAAAYEGEGSEAGDEEAVSTTQADKRQQQERFQGAALSSLSLSILKGESEAEQGLFLNRTEPEGAPPQRENTAASGETRKLVLPPETVSEAPAPRASTILRVASPGRSSWRSERVASLAGRASASSPTQRVPEALDCLAASRRPEDLGAEEETVIVDDLVVRHAPITAPLPAPRPLARVAGSEGSSSNSSSTTSQTLSASNASHQPPALSRVPGDNHTTQRPEVFLTHSAGPPQGPPSASAALEMAALAEASDALQRPLTAQCGGPPFALRGATPKPAPPSQFVASRPPQMRSATPLQPRPPPTLMRVLARPPPPPAPTLPLATRAPETAAAAAQQPQPQSSGPVSGLPAALLAKPASRPTPARPSPPQQSFLSPSWMPAGKPSQGVSPVGLRAEVAPEPQEGPSSSTNTPFKAPPGVLQPTKEPVRPGPRPAPPQDSRMHARPPEAALSAPAASQPQPRLPPFLLAAAAQLARHPEQQAMGPSIASRPPPLSHLQGAAALGETPATPAAAAATDCPPQRGTLELASSAPTPPVSSPFSPVSIYYGRRPPPFPWPDSSVSTGSKGPLPPPRRPSPIGLTRPPVGLPTYAPPDSFFTPSLSSTNSLAVPIYASGRETPVSVRPPAGPPGPHPASLSSAATPAAGGPQPPRLASPLLPVSAAAALGLLQQRPPVAGRPTGLPALDHERGDAALPAHATDQSGSRAPAQEPRASLLTSRLTSIRPPENFPAAAAAALAAAPVQMEHVSRPPRFSPALTPDPAGPREAQGGLPLTAGVQRPPEGPLLFPRRPATPVPAVSSAARPPFPPEARSQSPFPSGRPPASAAPPWLLAPTAHTALSPATARPPQRPLPAAPPGSSAAPPGGPLDPPRVGDDPRPHTAAGPVTPWTSIRPPASLLGEPLHSPLAASRGALRVATRPPARPELPAGYSRPPTPMAPVAAAPSNAPFLSTDGLPGQFSLSSEGPPPHQLGPLMAGTGAPRPPSRPFLNPSAPLRPGLRPLGLAESFSRASTPGLLSELPAAASVPPPPGPPPTALERPPARPPALFPAIGFRPVPASLRQPSPANRQLLPKPDP
ncbi:hypothetical protein Emag_007595 [Eimeria magna]